MIFESKRSAPDDGYRPVASVVNLVPRSSQRVFNMSIEEALAVLETGESERVAQIEGSFALVVRKNERVLLARSLDRPLRYFLAKQEAGPLLVVAERIDQIGRHLEDLGFGDQFHPSYTRMVPAHYVTTLRLVGCPDPNPVYTRFFDPPRETLPQDLDLIGERYVSALMAEVSRYLANQSEEERKEPLGVCFSGGIDSGAVLVAVHAALREAGQSPARLKAFTLAVGAGGEDAGQAREFLRALDFEMLGERIEVPIAALDPFRAVEVIEDYKPLDVECATMGLALMEGIRRRYPQWRLLLDGDGGDENLKDYPIEENSELTIRSVVNNLMLYHEGWGVGSIKHSLTYSGGLSRGYVRTLGPARALGFDGFSPFVQPGVVAVAEAIPFRALTSGSHQALYALKGEVVKRGMKSVLGIDFPVFGKRRFQRGAVAEGSFSSVFDVAPEAYRRHFVDSYG